MINLEIAGRWSSVNSKVCKSGVSNQSRAACRPLLLGPVLGEQPVNACRQLFDLSSRRRRAALQQLQRPFLRFDVGAQRLELPFPARPVLEHPEAAPASLAASAWNFRAEVLL